jgi:hypothetical protein
MKLGIMGFEIQAAVYFNCSTPVIRQSTGIIE